MDPNFKATPIDILLVEDNPGDQELTREAFQEVCIANTLHVVDDGEQAMQFLRGVGKFTGMPRPDLILLDLNLPGKDGREVLAEIKEDPKLKTIPVVVLTTSSAEQDVNASYNHYANCYLTKPVGYENFLDIIRRLESFWLTVVRLPAT